MKKLIVGLFAITAMVSCTQDNNASKTSTATTLESNNWITAKLDYNFNKSQSGTTAYLFSTSAVKTLMQTAQYDHMRFVLGYENNGITLNAVGVSTTGATGNTVVSKIVTGSDLFTSQVQQLNKQNTKAMQLEKAVASHLLSTNEAYTYINTWKTKLSNPQDLAPVTSYNGERIRYFVMDNAVINTLLSSANIAHIGVLLGVNPQGKLTTVFVGLDKQNNLILPNNTQTKKMEDAGVYDYTHPCPTTCDVGSQAL